MNNELILNINKIHTTKLGKERIKKNLDLEINDIILYCKKLILSKNAFIYLKGKNYYCKVDNILITINAHSFTIITAHKI